MTVAETLQASPEPRLLVVAAAPVLAEQCRQALTSAGYEARPRCVGSLAELGAVLQEDAWDLVLVVAGPPSLGIAAVAEAIRAHDPHLSLIVLSDLGGEGRAVDAMRQGAADFVVTDDAPRLAAAVERELRGAARTASGPSHAETGEGSFRGLVERSLQGVLVHRGGLPLYVNRAFVEALGYDDAAQVLGLPSVEALLHPDERERLGGYARRQADAGALPKRYECRALRRDGSTAWFECGVSTIAWEGQPAYLVDIVDITDRKDVQLRLERQEALLQQVIDCIPHILFASDADSRYMLVNRAFADAVGWPAEEMLGRKLADLGSSVPIAPEVALESDRAILIEGQERVDRIEPITAPDGSEGFVRTLKAPLHDHRGQVWGLIGMVEDVTERRRLEAERERDRERLADAIESAPAAVYYCDAEGRLEIWNSKVVEFFPNAAGLLSQGLPYETFLRELVPLFKDVPDDVDTWLQQRMSRMGRLGREGMEVNLVDGRALLVQDRRSLAGGTVVIVMDITDRKRAEAALAASEANFRSLIEWAPDAIFIANPQDRFLLANPAACELTGYGEAELLSMGVEDLVLPESLQREPLRRDQVLRGQRLLVERPFRRKDGSVAVVEIGVSLRPDGNIQGIVRDISQRRQAEAALRASERLLHAVFETMPLSVFVKDAEARYVLTNSVTERTWRVSSGALVGRRVTELPTIPEAQRARHAEHDRLILSAAVPRIEDIGTWSPVASEERTLRTVKRPLKDEGGRIYGLMGFAEDVTELERAHRSLRESKGLLQAVFDAMPQLVFVKDKRARYLMVNRHFAEAMAMAPEELIGDVLREGLVEPEHERLGAIENDRQILSGELDRSDEVRQLRFADGLTRSMRVIKEPLKDEMGRIYGLVGLSEDITPLREAEAKAAAAHARLADAVQNLDAAFYLYDRNERLVLWNDRVTEFFPHLKGLIQPGMSFEELLRLSTPIVDLPSDQFEAQLQRRLAEFRNPPPQPIEQHLRDGRWLLVRERKTATGDTVSLRQDITVLKHTESALRRSEERFRMLTENAPDVIFRYRLWPEPGFDYVSPVSAATIGYTPAEHYADPQLWLRIAHPEDRQQQERLFRLDAETPSALVLVRWRYKDADWVWIEQRCTPVFDEAGRLTAIEGIVRDVTSRKELEHQLLQAQRMEAVGQLAGGIAHDFNNMLSVMGSYSTFVLEQLPVGDPAREDVKVIQDAVERSATLTRQLLAFSRKQMLRMERVELNTLLSQMEKILRRVIGEDVVLESRLHPALGDVTADPAQIEQIVMNLAVNARDAMPSGGMLTLETENVEVESELALQHRDLAPGPYVMLAVTDTGTGMSPEVREHIFEPFFTTKNVGKGTGLGLSTVYGIVKQMGGEIWVHSKPGMGATFKIYLPRAGDGKAAAPVVPPASRNDLTGSGTILLVEDEDLVRVAGKRILEGHGYHVIAARNARDAEAASARADLAVDLLLTDVVMPEISGPQLVERLTSLRPSLRVVYVTGYAESTLGHHLDTQRMPDVIHKPFSPEVLLRTVRQVLCRSEY